MLRQHIQWLRPYASRLLPTLTALVMCLAILAGVPTSSASLQKHTFAWDMRERHAYDILLEADAHTHPGYTKLALESLVVGSDHSGRIFKALLEDATPTGQVYALIGLSVVDPVYFEQVLPEYQNSKVMVPVRHGCLAHDVPIATIAQGIADTPKSRSATIQLDLLFH